MRQLGPLDLVLCPSRGVPVTDDMRCEGVEVVVSATTQSGRPLPFDADRPHSTHSSQSLSLSRARKADIRANRMRDTQADLLVGRVGSLGNRPVVSYRSRQAKVHGQFSISERLPCRGRLKGQT